jgi:hypothetical protein
MRRSQMGVALDHRQGAPAAKLLDGP